MIAGGRGIFPLAGLAAEYKKQNCRVLLFCGFKDSINLIRREELEESSDQLILAFENNSDAIKTTRENDQIFSVYYVLYFVVLRVQQLLDTLIVLETSLRMDHIPIHLMYFHALK